MCTRPMSPSTWFAGASIARSMRVTTGRRSSTALSWRSPQAKTRLPSSKASRTASMMRSRLRSTICSTTSVACAPSASRAGRSQPQSWPSPTASNPSRHRKGVPGWFHRRRGAPWRANQRQPLRMMARRRPTAGCLTPAPPQPPRGPRRRRSRLPRTRARTRKRTRKKPPMAVSHPHRRLRPRRRPSAASSGSGPRRGRCRSGGLADKRRARAGCRRARTRPPRPPPT
mmetsp:Transcript_58736/g.151034  ORF Transcript_58736/g.151034 Transcript_58736/m.151034 type:complete len:228 (+) Transcript_58736:510-1193(+)